MSLIKLLLRASRVVFWQLLLAEVAALVFLTGWFFVSEGVSQDTFAEIVHSFALVAKYFTPVAYFVLLERAMGSEVRKAAMAAQSTAQSARYEGQPAPAAPVEPSYITAATAASESPSLDVPEVRHFEPADHIDDSLVNPATGLMMQGGYEGFDSSGHTYGESDMAQPAVEAPAQLPLFN